MWAAIITGAVGVWLMASPSILGYAPPAQTNDWVVGPIIAMIGCVAIAEGTRPVIRGAIVPGLWLLLAPLILGYEQTALWNSLAAGVVVSVLSLVAKPMDPARFGGGWSVLWNPVLRRRMYADVPEPGAREPRGTESGHAEG